MDPSNGFRRCPANAAKSTSTCHSRRSLRQNNAFDEWKTKIHDDSHSVKRVKFTARCNRLTHVPLRNIPSPVPIASRFFFLYLVCLHLPEPTSSVLSLSQVERLRSLGLCPKPSTREMWGRHTPDRKISYGCSLWGIGRPINFK